MICNQSDFEKSELKNKDWYLENYPFLTAFEFPVAYKDLQSFYLADMQKRNLTPQENWLNCYEAVFSYFIENYPRQNDSTRFRGKTFLERFPQNLYDALGKTLSPVANIFQGAFNLVDLVGNIAKNFYWLAVPVVGYIIYLKFLKK